MTDKIQHTSGNIESYFRLNFLLGETLTAELHNAIELKTGKAANIWISKDKVDLKSDSAHELLAHLHIYDGINPAISDFDFYGCDSEGKFFLVFSHNFDINFLLPRGNFDEMIRRLYRSFNLISKLHDNEIFIGSLSDKSFYLSKSGTVKLCSGIRSFSHDAGKLIEGLNKSDLAYIAPELAKGEFSSKSDVYALGVLGFKAVFDKLHLDPVYRNGSLVVSSDISQLTITSDLNNLVRVLSKAIDPNPENRYVSATQLLEALVAALSTEKVNSSEEESVKKEQISVLPALKRKKDQLAKVAEQEEKKVSRVIAWSIVSVLILSFVVGIFVYRKYQTRLAHDIEAATAPFSGGNPELTRSVATITNLSTELKEKIQEIQELSDSRDPLSYSLLVASATKSKDQNILNSSQAALIDKLNKLKFPLSAIQLEQWLRYSGVDPSDPIYKNILNALDPAIPDNKRMELLEKITKLDLNIATRLTAALYFDHNQKVDYGKLLRLQIAEPYNIESADNLSSLALIIYHENLNQIFSTNVLKGLNVLTVDDLKFILPETHKFNETLRNNILALAIKQKVLGEESNLFLKTISENPSLNSDLQQVLIKIASGNISLKDLQIVNSWRDPQAEKLLILALNLIIDEEERLKLFDLLATRNIKSLPAETLMSFFKDKLWSNRGKYISAFGVISVSESYSDDQIAEALRTFKKYFNNYKLQSIFLNDSNERVAKIFVNNFHGQLGLAQKINLLRHQDVNIRKFVVNNLETNDVGAIKLISEAYKQEKNAEIREMYKKNFWFINQDKGSNRR